MLSENRLSDARSCSPQFQSSLISVQKQAARGPTQVKEANNMHDSMVCNAKQPSFLLLTFVKKIGSTTYKLEYICRYPCNLRIAFCLLKIFGQDKNSHQNKSLSCSLLQSNTQPFWLLVNVAAFRAWLTLLLLLLFKI